MPGTFRNAAESTGMSSSAEESLIGARGLRREGDAAGVRCARRAAVAPRATE